jgi:dihydroflavonol-4-reductase
MSGAMAATTLRAGDAVFVSGGTGFVGGRLIRRLLARGARVHALARDPAALRVPGTAAFAGDITDPQAVARAMAGARFAFHVAADYRLWVPDPEAMLAINVGGTETVMRAALEAGCERIVHTSSVATLKVSREPFPSDETRPLDEGEAIGTYKRSKVLAERRVEKLVAEAGLPAVIVNPSTPIGPEDVKPTPTGQMIVEAASGRMPAYVETGLNLVHVDDVADGHILALERGRIGERYVLGGEDIRLGALIATIADLAGQRKPLLALPRAPLHVLAAISEAHARLTGRTPLLTHDSLRMARYFMFFSSEKARRELGYAPRPMIEGLKTAIDWFREEGVLG